MKATLKTLAVILIIAASSRSEIAKAQRLNVEPLDGTEFFRTGRVRFEAEWRKLPHQPVTIVKEKPDSLEIKIENRDRKNDSDSSEREDRK